MLVYSLTSRTNTPWGDSYGSFEWKDEWQIFLNLENKEIRELSFRERCNWNDKSNPLIRHIICWFDRNVLQRIGEDSITTLNVRIRIVCGMINKVSPNKLSMELKRIFMECIWDTYYKFRRRHNEWYCKWILQLPF